MLRAPGCDCSTSMADSCVPSLPSGFGTPELSQLRTGRAFVFDDDGGDDDDDDDDGNMLHVIDI